MPLMRLIAENVGPFERLDIDFSDGNGKPHRGPHILAGVNGSGKSTVLRAIAWALSFDGDGFPEGEWRHFTRKDTRVAVQLRCANGYVINAASGDSDADCFKRLEEWVELSPLNGEVGLRQYLAADRGARFLSGSRRREDVIPPTCAYAPARSLSYVGAPPEVNPAGYANNCLAFEGTIRNGAIQRWWVDLFSRRALAKERGNEFEKYEEALCRLQEAVKLVCDDPGIELDVEFGAVIEPRVNYHGRKLNFSQLSDGARTTIGWLADFMMRQDHLGDLGQGGLLLLDEIDIYLHPRWQRTLLPAMREALPDTQIIASSHSPFVISSCADARVHRLTLDEQGVAHAEPPQPAPFGKSVMATLKGIFDVNSRFDIQTEKDLKEWDNLKKDEAVGKLTPAKGKQLETLANELADRGEELKLIVKPATPPDVNGAIRPRQPKRVKLR
jgi:predicted ATP-binding protein involved in virulence